MPAVTCTSVFPCKTGSVSSMRMVMLRLQVPVWFSLYSLLANAKSAETCCILTLLQCYIKGMRAIIPLVSDAFNAATMIRNVESLCVVYRTIIRMQSDLSPCGAANGCQPCGRLPCIGSPSLVARIHRCDNNRTTVFPT